MPGDECREAPDDADFVCWCSAGVGSGQRAAANSMPGLRRASLGLCSGNSRGREAVIGASSGGVAIDGNMGDECAREVPPPRSQAEQRCVQSAIQRRGAGRAARTGTGTGWRRRRRLGCMTSWRAPKGLRGVRVVGAALISSCRLLLDRLAASDRRSGGLPGKVL